MAATAAAAAAAAISSSFSPSINTTSTTLKCMRSKLYCPLPAADSSLLKLPLQSTSRLLTLALSHCHAIEALLGNSTVAHKWRVLKISAAVAQEEAAATEESVVEEEQEGEEEAPAAAAEAEAEADVNTKLYFGNLPYNVDSAMLAGIIQDYGSPEMVEVLYDRETGKSRGFAFVTMSTVEDCKKVIENLDGSQYQGRILRVNFSDKPKPRQTLYPETDYKLFVGNLSWSVTSESLTQAFQEYGNVVGARVLYDGDTGRSRGYGFVCYATKAEMETALASLNGMELEGRSMRVSLAQGKKQ